jgi:hypothetical protein
MFCHLMNDKREEWRRAGAGGETMDREVRSSVLGGALAAADKVID